MKKIIIVLACFLLTGCALQETKEPTENPPATAPAESTPEASAEASPTPSPETIQLAEGVNAEKQDGKLIISAFNGDVTLEMIDPLPSELNASFQMSEDQTTLQIELEFQAEGCTAKDGTCSNLFESYSISREQGENPIGTIKLDSMLTEENLKRYRELQGYPDGEWSENIQPVRYLLWTFDNEEQ